MDVQQVVERLDVMAFFASEGISLNRVGNQYKAKCPFHADDRPSLSVSLLGRWMCHGCGESGDAFSLYMRRHVVDFPTALNSIAEKFALSSAPAPTTYKTVDLSLNRPFDASLIIKWHGALMHNEEAKRYLIEERGLNEWVLVGLQIGWNGNRYTFPIKNEAGTVVNAKLYSPKSVDAKMLWAISGRKDTYIWPHVPTGDEVFLCEGEMDTMSARLLNLNAYTGTAGAKTWKPEWTPFFKGRKVTILYDNDEAGRTGSQMAAAALSAGGATVALTSWPEEFPKGFDVNAYLVSGGSKEGIEALVDRVVSVPVPDVSGPAVVLSNSLLTFDEAPSIVALIDPSSTPIDVMKEMRKHMTSIAEWTETEIRLFYTGPFAAHFKKNLNRNHVQALMKEAIEEQRKRQKMRKAGAVPGSVSIVDGESDQFLISDFKRIGLGQAFLDDSLYYTVTRGVVVKELTDDYKWVEKPQFQAVFISKDGLMSADADELSGHKFYLNGVKPLVNFNESWPSDPKMAFSWSWYLKHKDQPDFLDVAMLYEEVRRVMSTYLYVGDDEFYDVLSCYVMLTYVHRVFRTVGYVWMRALRGSGKTTVLDIFSCLAFNAMKVIDPTNAFMYRKIAATSATLLIDEAEKLGRQDEGASQLRELLNAGYQAGNVVGRIEKDASGNFQQVEFDVYGPKLLASIGDPDPTLADRCIVYDMERSPRPILDFPSDRAHERWVMLRNRLHCFGLFYATTVKNANEELRITEAGPATPLAERVTDVLRNRDRQVWTPVLAMALTVDHERERLKVSHGTPLFDRVLDYAKRYVVGKQSSVAEESDFQVVMGVRHFVRNTVPRAGGWYNSAELLNHIRNIEGVHDKYSAKRLNSTLFNKLKVGNPGTDRKRMTGERAMFYRIDPDVLERKCRAYLLPDDDVLSFREEPTYGKATDKKKGGDEESESETEMERAAEDLFGKPPELPY